MAFFVLSFSMVGSACYAEVPPSAKGPSSVPAQGSTLAVVKAAATGQWSDGWYQGAAGYEKAIQEYKQTQKPVAVYINVGWCPYCRRFEKNVLSSPAVKNFMKDKIKVSLNPEAGPRENEIVSQYRIRGFPSFFLHSPQSVQAMQLNTGVSPEEFIQLFEKAQK